MSLGVKNGTIVVTGEAADIVPFAEDGLISVLGGVVNGGMVISVADGSIAITGSVPSIVAVLRVVNGEIAVSATNAPARRLSVLTPADGLVACEGDTVALGSVYRVGVEAGEIAALGEAARVHSAGGLAVDDGTVAVSGTTPDGEAGDARPLYSRPYIAFEGKSVAGVVTEELVPLY